MARGQLFGGERPPADDGVIDGGVNGVPRDLGVGGGGRCGRFI